MLRPWLLLLCAALASTGNGALTSKTVYIEETEEYKWKGKSTEGERSLFVGGDFAAVTAGAPPLLIEGIGLLEDDSWTAVPGAPKSVGTINDMAVIEANDKLNTSSLLVMGGKFKEAGGLLAGANSVVIYNPDTASFVSLCDGIAGEVQALVVVQGKIYIGGDFLSVRACDGSTILVNNIVVFDIATSTWSSLGDGLQAAVVVDIAVDPAHDPPIVYAIGYTQAPIQPFVQKFSGNNWTPLGSGSINSDVQLRAAGVHPKTGDLFVGGQFAKLGTSVRLNNVGRWNGTAWLPIGGGLTVAPAGVNDLVFTAGGNLIVGGQFGQAGDVQVANIALYDMASGNWSSMAGGLSGQINIRCLQQAPSRVPHVRSLSIRADQLFVTGKFDTAGSNTTVHNVALFDISKNHWEAAGNDTMFANTVLYTSAIGRGGVTFVAGQHEVSYPFAEFPVDSLIFASFTPVVESDAEQRQQAGSWHLLLQDVTKGILDVGKVHAIVRNVTDLFVGGNFITVGDLVMHNVARFNTASQTWHPVGDLHATASEFGIIGGVVHALAVNGNELIVAGNFNFTSADSATHTSIARWSAAAESWLPMRGGIRGDCSYENSVYALAVGADHFLYIAGSFHGVDVAATSSFFDHTDGSNPILLDSPNFARWDFMSERWEAIGIRASLSSNSQPFVRSLIAFGTDLVVGGSFVLSPFQDRRRIASNVSNNIAVWDTTKSQWCPNYPGVALATSFGSPSGYIIAMEFVGPNALVIGGSFDKVNGELVHNLALCENFTMGSTSWQSVGGGFQTNDGLPSVNALQWDPSDYALYAGGVFSTVGASGAAVDNLARFSNGEWSSLSNGLSRWNGPVLTLELGLVPHSLSTGITTKSSGGNPDGLFVSRTFVYVAVGIGAAFVALVAVLVILVVRRARDREGYVPVPTMDGFGDKPVSLKDLAADANIRLIPRAELELHARLSHGVSGDVWKGTWTRPEQDGGGQLTVAVKQMALTVLLSSSDALSRSAPGASDLRHDIPSRRNDDIDGEYTMGERRNTFSGDLAPRAVHADSRRFDSMNQAREAAARPVEPSDAVLGSSYIPSSEVQPPSLPGSVRRYDSSFARAMVSAKDPLLDDSSSVSSASTFDTVSTAGGYSAVSVNPRSLRGRANTRVGDKAKADFLYEIKIMASLDHPNILRFLGCTVGEREGDDVLLVTEFMEHGSLRDVLNAVLAGRLRVDWRLKIRFAVDAARGMAYLHACKPAIVHRDLKSSNLLIDRKWRCHVSDFGISRVKKSTLAGTESTSHSTATVVGTPAYMAPETISRNAFSEPADVYSFGVVLAELVDGQPPFSELDLFPQQVMYGVVHEGLRPTVAASCPPSLRALIDDCLSAEPHKRPDFEEVKKRLKRM